MRDPNQQADMPLFHVPGPDTERQASERHEKSGRAMVNRLTVWSLVNEHPGCTSAELAWHTRLIDKHEIRRRLTDLLNRGEVVQGEPRTCRIANTAAVTWRVAK